MHDTDSPIRAVAFDYGGVLASFIDDDALCHMAAVAGAPLEVFRRALWGHRPEFDSGGIDADSYWRAVLDSCRTDAGGRSGDDIAGTIELLMCLDSLGWSRMNLAVMRWAGSLRRLGYRTLIISNMSVPAYEALIRDQHWVGLFDYVLVSGAIGVNKPDPAIFERAVNDMHLNPVSVLFVDDGEPNVAAARRFGMPALHFTNARSFADELDRSGFDLPTSGLRCEGP